MSGLLALLDDVAGIAKVAAASVDDVAGMTVKAGAKVSGVVIDDAAVTPAYVTGFSADRELPIIWKIARGSIFNKLVILLPVALLLSAFAPWAIPPLLMIGGAYLTFEGAEKVLHWLRPHTPHADGHVEDDVDPVRLEEERVRGAIKTDFILSAEIMTIALSTLPAGQTIWMQAGVLAAVAIGITALVYGGVALIVKMDDIGLHLAKGVTGARAALGRGILRVMPGFMKTLTIVGTAAMIWVGGNIVVHGLHELGLHEPYNTIHHLADSASAAAGGSGFVNWLVTAALDGVVGLILGFALIPVATHLINPLIGALTGKSAAH